MKKLVMLSLFFFALSMQVEAATMSWVSAPVIDSDNSTTLITAHKGYNADTSIPEVVNFTFNLSGQTVVNSIGIEFYDNQFDITSVKLLTGPTPFSFSTQTILGKVVGAWSLGNVSLAAGVHTIEVAVKSALSGGQFDVKVNAVPVPAAIWLFGSALMGLVGFSRRKSSSAMAV